MTIRVHRVLVWGWLALAFSAGCDHREPPALSGMQDQETFEKPIGKSKFANETCEEFLKQLRAAFSEDGRSPDELDGTLLGGVVRAATIEQQFGKPDRVFHDERSDGKPSWHWYLKDGEVVIDVVEELEESGDKLLKIGEVGHSPY